MRVRLERLGAAARVVLRDLAGLAGLGAIAYGAWLIYQPAGFIVGGGELVGAVWLQARATERQT